MELSLSQEKVAEILGVSTLTVSKYETGRRSPRLSILARFAELCGYPISWFCDEEFRNLSLPVLIWATDDQFCLRWVFGPLTHALPPRSQIVGRLVTSWFGPTAPICKAHQQAGEQGQFGATLGLGAELVYAVIQRQPGGFQGIAVRVSGNEETGLPQPSCYEQLLNLQRQIQDLSARLPRN